MDYLHKAWACPWYSKNDRMKHSGRTKLYCGGCCALVFTDSTAAKQFFDRYCASNGKTVDGKPVHRGYRDCTIAKMKEEQYERTGSE